MVTTTSTTSQPLQLLTPLGKDALYLVGFAGREGLSQLFRFQLELLADNRREIAFERLLGQRATIALALSAGKSRYFTGIISRFSQGERDDAFTCYRAEMVPQLWLLTRRAQCRIFQHKSVPEILKEVLAGLDVRFELEGTFHRRNYCVQYRESDFAFASRLMEEEGIYYFFKHTADGQQMVVGNSPQSHPDVPEQHTVVYDAIEGGVRPDFRITEWEKMQEVRPGKVTLRDHWFELPDKQLEVERGTLDTVAVGKVAHSLKLVGPETREVYDYPGGYGWHFDGIDKGGGEQPENLKKVFEENQRVAAIRMQQETVAGLQIQGAGNCRQFVSGHRFTLARHFNADGAYVLTEIEHKCSLGGNYRSGNGTALEYHNRFTCIPLGLPFRPTGSTPRPRVDGAQTAIVVGPAGEEIFTDKYGRVKVQFPWDRQGQHNADSSCWVRVATPWAGKRWGAVQIPRIGQEVLVDFLEGDPDRPIIVGSVYNAEQMPPFALPGGKQVSGLKTNSYPTSGGSNEITLDDTKGKEKINVHGQYDMNTTVDHDMTTTVHNNRTSTVDVNSTETVHGTKTTTVDGNVAEIYNAALTTIVKSGALLTSTGSHVHVIAATEVMLNSGASTLVLKSDGTIELIGVNISINGKAVVGIDAPKVNVIGGAETLMGVGGQTVHCDGGQVVVSGAEITSAADGTHNIKGALVKIN
jgi:type VI secretion system secreted protein VgrG